jgi:hypothetical protein
MHFFHAECFVREKAYKALAARCAKINREQFFFTHDDTSLVFLLDKNKKRAITRRRILLAMARTAVQQAFLRADSDDHSTDGLCSAGDCDATGAWRAGHLLQQP